MLYFTAVLEAADSCTLKVMLRDRLLPSSIAASTIEIVGPPPPPPEATVTCLLVLPVAPPLSVTLSFTV